MPGTPSFNWHPDSVDLRQTPLAWKGAQVVVIAAGVTRKLGVTRLRLLQRNALLHDQRGILSFCCRITGVAGLERVTLPLPHIVGGQSALANIPVPLDHAEQRAINQTADVLRGALDSLKLD